MTRKLISNKLIYALGCCLILGVLLPLSASAADSPVGVAYRGHIQDLGDYPTDGSWVDSPEIIGTEGQSKRIEGFEIKLTGTVPDGMALRYNVHVQNKGWLYDEEDPADWPKDGEYAGTRGESLRIEAVKIVLTDADGQPVTGYTVQYRGHVQNVGDLPTDESQWLADGAQLGTVGSSQRLEALLVKVVKTGTDPVEPAEPTVYDKAGSYGPAKDTQTIAGDVTVAADGVILQNLVIQGNLTISEAVGNGNVTLNNVTVKGDTFVRGGGVNSIKINGGEYSRIVMEKTASGAVRIMAKDVDGLDVVISEDASGETIILEGAFDSVTVNAPNMIVTIQGNTTTIGKMTVGAGAAGSTVTVAAGTTVADLVLDAKVAVKGQGTVAKAEVKADGVVFDKKPGVYTVASGVVIPPVFPTDSGGGYNLPTTIAVSGVSLNKSDLILSYNANETLVATVAPAGATNKAVSWTSSDDTIATVAADGKVTGNKKGQATITVSTQDGNKTATCAVTVEELQPAIAGVTLPFAGETPVTAITGTNQYTGTVSWQKKVGSTLTALTASDKFDGTITYVATISLSLLAPYTQADIEANFFKVAGATATNDAGALVITAEFLPTNQYKITDLGVITGYSGPGGDILVPAMVNNKVVKEIGANAFNGQTAITAITLPVTVTAIGSSAFKKCTGLTAVTFDPLAELKTIDTMAFAFCQLLTSIAIPDQVTEIGESAFSGCTQLHTVTISANSALKSIGYNAFNGCSALTAIAIPADLTSLGAAAFCYCSALKSVNIPSNLTAIGDYTFYGCTALATITFRGPTPSLGAYAIANGTTIRHYANYNGYDGWSGMNYVHILAPPVLATPTVTNTGSPVVDLEWAPVDEATGYEVYISENSNLSAATIIPATEAKAKIDAGVVAGKTYYFAVKAKDANGESLMSEVQSADLNIAVTGVTVSPATVPLLIVGAGTTLTATVLPDNAANKAVTWSSSNEAVATVDTGGTVTAIAEGTATITATSAADVTKLNTCEVKVKPVFEATDSGSLGTITKYNGSEANVEIPDKIGDVPVTAIGADAFKNKDTIQSVTIPATVTSIGATAFLDCDGLNKVTFAGTSELVTIGANAFERCVRLANITLPPNLTTIGTQAFLNCYALTAVIIPSEVTTIGVATFQNCYALSAVSFADGSGLTKIDENAFTQCPITTLTLPDMLQTIGNNAFYYNRLTGTLIIPATVTSIGKMAFERKTGVGGSPVTTLEIKASTLTIGSGAFKYQNLTSITIPAGVNISADTETMGTYDGSGFRTAYVGAGTYTYIPSVWSKQI